MSESELLDGYPNLSAVLDGRVSGEVTEWPVIRRELLNLAEQCAAKDRRIAELEAQSLDDARSIDRLCKTIRYLQGIAEFGHGYMVPINEDETIEQYVLNYVKRIEARIEQLKAENAELEAREKLHNAVMENVPTMEQLEAREQAALRQEEAKQHGEPKPTR